MLVPQLCKQQLMVHRADYIILHYCVHALVSVNKHFQENFELWDTVKSKPMQNVLAARC